MSNDSEEIILAIAPSAESLAELEDGDTDPQLEEVLEQNGFQQLSDGSWEKQKTLPE